MTLMRVHLELAREPGHPDGSRAHGYDIVAPIDAAGHLNLEEWRSTREQCTVRRFWPNEVDKHGHLTHNGSHWKFHYAGEPVDADDPVYKLGSHRLAVGEYISVNEDDGEMHTYRVARVVPLK